MTDIVATLLHSSYTGSRYNEENIKGGEVERASNVHKLRKINQDCKEGHSPVSTNPQRSLTEIFGKLEALKQGDVSERSVSSGQTHAEVRRSFLKSLNIQSAADSSSSASTSKPPSVGRCALVAALRAGSSSVNLSDRLKDVQSESLSSAGLVSADKSTPVSLENVKEIHLDVMKPVCFENVKKIDLDVMKPVCRFFTKGHCRRGASCRYLHHPGVRDKVIMPSKSFSIKAKLSSILSVLNSFISRQ